MTSHNLFILSAQERVFFFLTLFRLQFEQKKKVATNRNHQKWYRDLVPSAFQDYVCAETSRIIKLRTELKP